MKINDIEERAMLSVANNRNKRDTEKAILRKQPHQSF